MIWLVFGILAIPGGTPDAVSIPDTIAEAGSSVPAWVAASVASDADGSPRKGLFSPAERKEVDAMLELPASDGCARVAKIAVDRIGPDRDRSTLDAAIRSADLVAVVRVAASRGGFFRGMPGTLVAVVPESVYKGGGPKIYYEFFPVGDVDFSGKRICKTDGDYTVPEIGALQLVTASDPAGVDRNVLPAEDASDFIAVGSDGEVALPARYVQADPTLAGIEMRALESRLVERAWEPAGQAVLP